MLDIHAHLYWESYDADRDLMIKRAFAAGIERMICVGTTIEESKKAIAVAEQYENIFAAVGLHPHFFNEMAEKATQSEMKHSLKELQIVAKHEKVVAIGECGLDYFSRDAEHPIADIQKVIQKEGFLAQMEIAESEHLPLVIHTRPSLGTMDTYEDMIEILRDTKYQIPNRVLHCYQGDTEVTKKFLEIPNVYFSFAGNVTYPVKKVLVGTRDDLREVVKLVPLERIFVETDAPFLAPEGHRGERNEPAFAVSTAEKVCELKQCEFPVLEVSLLSNFAAVFGKM